ncbi:unnamed protein product, partial [Pylaiella littoralis]
MILPGGRRKVQLALFVAWKLPTRIAAATAAATDSGGRAIILEKQPTAVGARINGIGGSAPTGARGGSSWLGATVVTEEEPLWSWSDAASRGGRLGNSGSADVITSERRQLQSSTTSLLSSGSSSANDSCVQVSDPSFVSNPAFVSGGTFAFTMEGTTTVTANVVNLAVVIDGSKSIGVDNFEVAKEFAKDTVEAFADKNLFENGGTASFVQFSESAESGGPFFSQEAYDYYVDRQEHMNRSTDIASGIEAGRERLALAPEATVAFMVIMTDGNGDVADEANAARAEGTILYAVGVPDTLNGNPADSETLQAIAGDLDNVFDLEEFSELESAVGDIIESTTNIPCPATGATITFEFSAGVVAVSASVDDALGSATVGSDGSTVVFDVSSLEDKPTLFAAVLDFCADPGGSYFAASVFYSDDEGNTPDLSSLLDFLAALPTCVVTPAPTTGPTPAPTLVDTPVECVAPDCTTCSEWDCGFGYAPVEEWGDAICFLDGSGSAADSGHSGYSGYPGSYDCTDDYCCERLREEDCMKYECGLNGIPLAGTCDNSNGYSSSATSLGGCSFATCCQVFTCGSDYACATATDTVLEDAVCRTYPCSDDDCCEPGTTPPTPSPTVGPVLTSPPTGSPTVFTCGSDYACATATDTVLEDAVCRTYPCSDDDCCEPGTTPPTPSPTVGPVLTSPPTGSPTVFTCGSDYACATATDTVLEDAVCRTYPCSDDDCCEPALTCCSDYACPTATDTVLEDAICRTYPCSHDDCCEPAPTCGSDYACANPTDTVLEDAVCYSSCSDQYCCEPAPTTPAPSTPAPSTPAPSTPTPSTPAPSTPAPSTPAPSTLAPNTPAPSTPSPSTPAPGTPAPSTPAPSTPAPSTPAPGTPAPSTPAPSTPAPSTPAPSTPAPSTPSPRTRAPSTPAPSAPAPSTPAPSTPSPSSPAPSTPAPSTPAPSTPAPGTPAPSTPAPSTPSPSSPAPSTPAPSTPA